MQNHLQITQEEWNWVRRLVGEVQRQEQCDSFAKTLGQWHLAVRMFRAAEERMLEGCSDPTADEKTSHSMCLNALLAIGKSLMVKARSFSGEELQQYQVRHDEIAAYVQELEMSYSDWNSELGEDQRVEILSKALGAQTC